MSAHKLTIKADPKLQVGARGKNIENLQLYLATFGYLPKPKAPKGHKAAGKLKHIAFASHDAFVEKSSPIGTFDEATREALMSFQAFHGLKPTGAIDMGTQALLHRRRCGMPDNPGGGNSVGNFTLGPRWSKTDLTYRISKFSNGGLSEELIDIAVEAAFGLWSSVTPLTFQRVDSGADIDIRFEAGNHHDGHPFGGPFGVLAHAFFPEDGRAHFDDAETWAVDFPPANDAIDLISVAAHEFGHILGLEHTNVAGALMFPDYTAPQRFLAQDDINRIQSLYPFS